jgi:hypothetical protein
MTFLSQVTESVSASLLYMSQCPIMVTRVIINPKRGSYSVNALRRIFLTLALMTGVLATFVMTTSAMTLTKIAEATILLDLCKTYGISCPDLDPNPDPDPEPPTTGEPSYTRMIWTTTRSVTAQRDLATSLLGGGDAIVFHYGSGQDPTRAQINALKAVTKVSDGKKGMEFFSLAEIRAHAPTVKANGFGFISYDLEAGASPDREVANPLESVRRAKTIANENSIGLWVAPSNAISSGQYADDIAIRAGSYHLQSQPKQDDDTTCQVMKDWIGGRVRLLEGEKSSLEGKISFQVTLTSKPAPGKTIYDTAKDCIDKTIPGDVDSVSIWWGGAQFDDGTYKRLLKYVEVRFS